MRPSLALLLPVLPAICAGYQVAISDKDEIKQVCSGMYGGENAYINGERRRVPKLRSSLTLIRIVSFVNGSKGQLAMVIYEWEDVRWLGKETDPTQPVRPRRCVPPSH